MSSEKQSSRLKPALKIAIILLLFVTVYSLAGFFLLPRLIRSQAQEKLSLQLKRPTTIDEVRFNPFTLVLALDGLLIKEADGAAGPFIKIDHLQADLSLASIWHRALVLEKFTVQGPYSKIVRKENFKYNFSDLIPAPNPQAGAEKDRAFHFSVNNIKISGGIIEFVDQPQQAFHWINDITITLPRVANLPKLIETHVQPAFAAVINGTPLNLGGRSKPFADSLETTFEIDFTDLDLPYYLAYLPESSNFTVDRGRLSSQLKLSYLQAAAARPELHLQGSITLRDIEVSANTERDKKRFARLPETTIRLGNGNLLAGELFIEEIRCRRPEIDLRLDDNRQPYLPQILSDAKPAGPKPEPKPEKDTSADKFICRLDRLAIEEGMIDFADLKPDFSTQIESFNFTLEDFSTAPGSPAAYTLKLRSEAREELSAAGHFQLQPLEVMTDFALKQIPIPRYASYYQPFFAGRIERGLLAVSGQLSIAQDNENKTALGLRNFKTELKELNLRDEQDREVLTLPALEVASPHLDVSGRQLHDLSITAREAKLFLARLRDGRLNLAGLVPPAGPGQPAPPETQTGQTELKDPAEPWHFSLAETRLVDCGLSFTDNSLKNPAVLAADKINLQISHLGSGPGENGQLQSSLQLTGGRLDLHGDIGLAPPLADLQIDLQKLRLADCQPYLQENLDLLVLDGTLESSGRLTFRLPEKTPQLGFRGRAAVNSLQTADRARAEKFLGFQRMAVNGIDFQLEKRKIHLQEIALAGLRANFIRLADGGSNLQTILRPEPAAPAPAKNPDAPPAEKQSPEKQPAFDFALERIELKNGALNFYDQTCEPVFELTLDQLNGAVDELTAMGREPARIDYQGRLNHQAEILIKGSLAPLARELKADLAISGQDIGMTAFSPYAGRYVGQKIGKGKLSLDLNYRIDDRRLNADNRVFLDQFEFGQAVASPEATSLPVNLAVALLKNRQGEIDLNLPVSGDLDDPSFSLGGVIIKVFVNLITKAVTSPFALIGALAGGGEELNQVDFAPGLATLDEAAATKLSQLAKALYERPGLKVDIQGSVKAAADRRALEEAAFQKLLKLAKFKHKPGKGIDSVEQVTIQPDEFPKYLWRAYKAAPVDKEKNAIGLIKKIEPAKQEEILRQSVKVGDQELLTLARHRAEKVLAFLVEKGPIESKRLFLLEPPAPAAGSDQDQSRVEMKIK